MRELLGHLGAANGSFGPALENLTDGTETPLAIVAGDFNFDGNPDLMAVFVGSNNISFLRGRGDGTFDGYTFAGVVRDDPLMIVSGDFNQDGKLDVATANIDFFGGSVALGKGDGTIENPNRHIHEWPPGFSLDDRRLRQRWLPRPRFHFSCKSALDSRWQR